MGKTASDDILKKAIQQAFTITNKYGGVQFLKEVYKQLPRKDRPSDVAFKSGSVTSYFASKVRKMTKSLKSKEPKNRDDDINHANDNMSDDLNVDSPDINSTSDDSESEPTSDNTDSSELSHSDPIGNKNTSSSSINNLNGRYNTNSINNSNQGTNHKIIKTSIFGKKNSNSNSQTQSTTAKTNHSSIGLNNSEFSNNSRTTNHTTSLFPNTFRRTANGLNTPDTYELSPDLQGNRNIAKSPSNASSVSSTSQTKNTTTQPGPTIIEKIMDGLPDWPVRIINGFSDMIFQFNLDCFDVTCITRCCCNVSALIFIVIINMLIIYGGIQSYNYVRMQINYLILLASHAKIWLVNTYRINPTQFKFTRKDKLNINRNFNYTSNKDFENLNNTFNSTYNTQNNINSESNELIDQPLIVDLSEEDMQTVTTYVVVILTTIAAFFTTCLCCRVFCVNARNNKTKIFSSDYSRLQNYTQNSNFKNGQNNPLPNDDAIHIEEKYPCFKKRYERRSSQKFQKKKEKKNKKIINISSTSSSSTSSDQSSESDYNTRKHKKRQKQKRDNSKRESTIRIQKQIDRIITKFNDETYDGVLSWFYHQLDNLPKVHESTQYAQEFINAVPRALSESKIAVEIWEEVMMELKDSKTNSNKIQQIEEALISAEGGQSAARSRLDECKQNGREPRVYFSVFNKRCRGVKNLTQEEKVRVFKSNSDGKLMELLESLPEHEQNWRGVLKAKKIAQAIWRRCNNEDTEGLDVQYSNPISTGTNDTGTIPTECPTVTPEQKRSEVRKKISCRFWKKGCCPFGSQCQYLHNDSEKATVASTPQDQEDAKNLFEKVKKRLQSQGKDVSNFGVFPVILQNGKQLISPLTIDELQNEALRPAPHSRISSTIGKRKTQIIWGVDTCSAGTFITKKDYEKIRGDGASDSIPLIQPRPFNSFTNNSLGQKEYCTVTLNLTNTLGKIVTIELTAQITDGGQNTIGQNTNQQLQGDVLNSSNVYHIGKLNTKIPLYYDNSNTNYTNSITTTQPHITVAHPVIIPPRQTRSAQGVAIKSGKDNINQFDIRERYNRNICPRIISKFLTLIMSASIIPDVNSHTDKWKNDIDIQNRNVDSEFIIIPSISQQVKWNLIDENLRLQLTNQTESTLSFLPGHAFARLIPCTATIIEDETGNDSHNLVNNIISNDNSTNSTDVINDEIALSAPNEVIDAVEEQQLMDIFEPKIKHIGNQTIMKTARALLKHFLDVFHSKKSIQNGRRMRTINSYSYKIRIKPNPSYPFRKPYQKHSEDQEKIQPHIDKLQNADLIETTIPRRVCTSVFTRDKRDGRSRFVSDFSPISDQIVTESSTQNIQEIADWLVHGQMFNGIDLQDWFFQIPLLETIESKEWLTFADIKQAYRWKVMPQGFPPSSFASEQATNSTYGHLLWKTTCAYVDDISQRVLGNESREETSSTFSKLAEILQIENSNNCLKTDDDFNSAKCIVNLYHLLSASRKCHVTIAAEKTLIAVKQLPTLGLLLGDQQVKPDPARLEAYTKFPSPNNLLPDDYYDDGIVLRANPNLGLDLTYDFAKHNWTLQQANFPVPNIPIDQEIIDHVYIVKNRRLLPRRVANLNQVRKFIQSTQYYSNLIEGYSSLSRELRDMLNSKNSYPWWDINAEVCFRRIKAAVQSASVTCPNTTWPWVMRSDYSELGVAAALHQYRPVNEQVNISDDLDTDGFLKLSAVRSKRYQKQLIAASSRTLLPFERRYGARMGEGLGIHHGLRRFRVWIRNKRTLIITDHASLTTVLEKINQVTASRIERWMSEWISFPIKIVWSPGHENVEVDTLSRSPAINTTSNISESQRNSCTCNSEKKVNDIATSTSTTTVDRINSNLAIDESDSDDSELDNQYFIIKNSPQFRDQTLAQQLANSIHGVNAIEEGQPVFDGGEEQVLEGEVNSTNIPEVIPAVKSHNRLNKLWDNGLSVNKMKKVLKKIHDNLGHPNSRKLVKFLDSCGTYLSIIKLAKVLRCKYCINNKGPGPIPIARIPLIIEFNDIISLDQFIRNGIWYMVIIDVAEYYAIVSPLTKIITGRKQTTLTSDEIISIISHSWIQHYGPPRAVICDAFSAHTSQKFQDWGHHEGVTIHTTTDRAHQQNATAEIAIRWIAGTIAALSSNPDLKDTDPRIISAMAAGAHNSLSSFNSSTTPEMRVHGKSRRVVGVTDTPLTLSELEKPYIRQSQHIIDRRKDIRTLARKEYLTQVCLRRLSTSMDRKSRGNPKTFTVHDIDKQIRYWDGEALGKAKGWRDGFLVGIKNGGRECIIKTTNGRLIKRESRLVVELVRWDDGDFNDEENHDVADVPDNQLGKNRNAKE